MQQPDIRPGRDDDAAGVIRLIERCWADYSGRGLDIVAEEAALHALATHYGAQGGALWVAGAVAGMIATRPVTAHRWEICRMYVHPDRHGTGLAQRLVASAETHAVARGARRLELWTDTRFARAHRFYEKHGWRRGPKRVLPDYEEWHYTRAAGLGCPDIAEEAVDLPR